MQDRVIVAAIVAGDADGFAAAFDQYAPSLYASCHSVLPGPEAAEAVLDTFLVASATLDGLRDPDRLGPWLHAVARNECLRRLGPQSAAGGAEISGSADPDDEPPAVTLPTGLRGQVLTACADNSPTGRARRMSVTHRAGPFGPSGFPKPIGPSGPRWWRRVRRRPGVVAAVAVVAVVAMVTGITVIMTAGSGHLPQASGPRLGAGGPGPASSTARGRTSAAPSPARTASARAASPATTPGGTASPGTAAGRGTPRPTAPPSRTPAPPPFPPPSPSPSLPPPPSTPPSQGHLLLAPDNLLLTAKGGKPASGTFVLTAAGGPVAHYTVTVPAGLAGRVKVAPADGSLPDGANVTVTVTVTGKAALTTQVTVMPGDLTVTVVYKAKAPGA